VLTHKFSPWLTIKNVDFSKNQDLIWKNNILDKDGNKNKDYKKALKDQHFSAKESETVN
jgi:hypothetical protein